MSSGRDVDAAAETDPPQVIFLTLQKAGRRGKEEMATSRRRRPDPLPTTTFGPLRAAGLGPAPDRRRTGVVIIAAMP